MKVYSTNRSREFAYGLVRHLLETLAYSGQRVWVISPWTRDVEFAIGEMGHYAGVLGGHYDQIRFSALLSRVAERHELNFVTKPPHELVPLGRLPLLAKKLEQQRSLDQEEALGRHGLALAVELRDTIGFLEREVMLHRETYMMGVHLASAHARVYYLDRLHAKVTWTPSTAIIGSANFTVGGFYFNEELVLEVTDQPSHRALLTRVEELTARATPRDDYTLSAPLSRLGVSEASFLQLCNAPGLHNHPTMQALLHELSVLLR